jgi:hypothetical protein
VVMTTCLGCANNARRAEMELDIDNKNGPIRNGGLVAYKELGRQKSEEILS